MYTPRYIYNITNIHMYLYVFEAVKERLEGMNKHHYDPRTYLHIYMYTCEGL